MTTSYSFSQLMNFTRTTSATFVGNDGFIQNTPESVNLLTFTQQFDNAAWTKTSCSITADSTIAPDGTPTADTLNSTAAATGGPRLTQSPAIAGGTTYTLSAYFKILGTNFAFISLRTSGANWAGAEFDLVNSTINRNVSSGNVAYVDATITSAGNGWYRCAVTVTPTDTITAGTGFMFFGASDGSATFVGGFPQFTNSGTETLYVWGAQSEEVPAANKTLGSELRSTGAIGLLGTATAATYNTTTGVGEVSRVDFSNQSFVQWSSLSANPYKLVISCDSGVGIFARAGGPGGSPILIPVGTSTTIDVPAVTGLITISSSNTGTSTFTMTSIREITSITGMPSTYTRNVGGRFPARFEYDPITLQPRGMLIEEQRTNLFIRSDNFAGWSSSSVTVSVDSTVAPDGTTTADTLTSAVSTAYVFQNAPFTGDGTKSVSVFLKAGTSTNTAIQLRDTTTPATARALVNVTWSGGVATAVATVGTVEGLDPYPNGWYRLRILAPGIIAANANQLRIQPDTITSPGTGSVIAWGAQAENGAFATSYIPTVASQVTRTADQASIVAPMFAPWYNADEGSIVVSCSPIVVDNDIAFSISSSVGYGNSIYVPADSGSQFIVVNSSVVQANLDGGTITVNAVNKIAAAYRVNDFALSVGGGVPVTDNSGTIPAVDRSVIGGLENNTVNRFNGHIRHITYYPERLSNARLQELTA